MMPGWRSTRPFEQAAVVLAAVPARRALARQFVEALKTPDNVRVLQSFGFAVPKPIAR